MRVALKIFRESPDTLAMHVVGAAVAEADEATLS